MPLIDVNDHLAEVCARWPARFRGLGSARRVFTL